jgi:hypothetical protein
MTLEFSGLTGNEEVSIQGRTGGKRARNVERVERQLHEVR